MTTPLPTNEFPEERRLASVLCADVQGLTSLAERLDFEFISDLIKMVWLLVDEIIDNHGGYVDKHVGDSVMAVWGAPFGDENDAEQAVTAALVLLDEIERFAKESEMPGAVQLKIRVGINSGMVLTGYVGKRNDYTVMGETVNVANQILQVCSPGEVLISQSTHRLVRGVFDVKRVSTTVTIHRSTQSLRAYQVNGVMPQPSRTRYHSLESLETNMVGREVELSRLEQLYKQAVQDGKPVLVLVSGESGIGKSRLLMEFTNQLEVSDTPASLISARALAQTIQVPYFLWKSLWFLRFGLKDSDSQKDIQEKFLREIQRLWGFQLGPASSVEVAHVVGSLIGISFDDSPFLAGLEEDAQTRTKRSYDLTRELLRRMAAYRPMILLFDDLQFADKGSLELVMSLMEPSQYSLPLLILCGARPEFAKNHPDWLNQAHILELGPLAVSARTVSEAYPSLRIFPESILNEISERSDGNPYFMEELAQGLLKSGLSPDELSEEELLERTRALPLESLWVMLQARLDNLSHEARSVALLASVVGRIFWVGAVLAAANAGKKVATGELSFANAEILDRLIQEALRQLVRAELAFPRAKTTFSEDQEYIFKHSLLREVAYGLIPLKHLKYYHLAVAQWLESRNKIDLLLMAADHYKSGEDMEKAALLYERASELVSHQGAVREAQELLAQAGEIRVRYHLN